MERYYTDDQEKLFQEAKIASPGAVSSNKKTKSKTATSKSGSEPYECEICFLTLPKSVSNWLPPLQKWFADAN